MLAEQFRAAIGAARTTRALDDTTRLLWRAHAERHLTDDDAQAISESLQSRRGAIAAHRVGLPLALSKAAPGLRRASAPRSPCRAASIARRRRQTASGALPPQIACQFTLGEQAVLAVVAREMQRNQVCVLPVDAIAALAGVCRRKVQIAMRHAERLGLLLVRERRRPGLPSLPNVVTVVSAEWLGWLRLGPPLGQRGVGCRNLHTTSTKFLSKNASGRILGGGDTGERRQTAPGVLYQPRNGVRFRR